MNLIQMAKRRPDFIKNIVKKLLKPNKLNTKWKRVNLLRKSSFEN